MRPGEREVGFNSPPEEYEIEVHLKGEHGDRKGDSIHRITVNTQRAIRDFAYQASKQGFTMMRDDGFYHYPPSSIDHFYSTDKPK